MREAKRVCLDCGSKLKNRSKKTKRCKSCYEKYKKDNAKGRKTGRCIVCNKKLSTKNNSTGKCRECYLKSRPPAWNKGKTGLVPWNKGISVFKNKEDYRLHVNNMRREKYKNKTTSEKIADNLRTLIRNSIKRTGKYKKLSKTTVLLGCEIPFFKKYLEQLFEPGMSWFNYGNGYGKWNIDHIIPVSRFDLSSLEEQKKAFHYTNCRPMWAIDNIKKGNKLIDDIAAATLTGTVTY